MLGDDAQQQAEAGELEGFAVIHEKNLGWFEVTVIGIFLVALFESVGDIQGEPGSFERLHAIAVFEPVSKRAAGEKLHGVVNLVVLELVDIVDADDIGM